jgi:hypothetical protein
MIAIAPTQTHRTTMPPAAIGRTPSGLTTNILTLKDKFPTRTRHRDWMLAHRWVAQALARMGDAHQSVQSYIEFLRLWAKADQDLPSFARLGRSLNAGARRYTEIRFPIAALGLAVRRDAFRMAEAAEPQWLPASLVFHWRLISEAVRRMGAERLRRVDDFKTRKASQGSRPRSSRAWQLPAPTRPTG